MNETLVYIDGLLTDSDAYAVHGVGAVYDITDDQDAAWTLHPKHMDFLVYEEGRLVKRYGGKPYLTLVALKPGLWRRTYSLTPPEGTIDSTP